MWRTRCWGSARADNVKSNSPETEGEMYLCNARYLCIWAVQLATRPNWPLVGNFPGVQFGNLHFVCRTSVLIIWRIGCKLSVRMWGIGIVLPNRVLQTPLKRARSDRVPNNSNKSRPTN